MTVQRILNMPSGRAITHIEPDAAIAQLLQSAEFKESGAMVVSSDGSAIAGIISERDIVRELMRDLAGMGVNLLGKPVRDLMTPKVLTCAPGDRASGIMAIMVSKHLRHFPVVTDGKLVGMVNVYDLLQLRLNEVQSEADAMRSYINGSS